MAKTYLQAAEETSNIESENQMERNTHISEGEKIQLVCTKPEQYQ